MTRHISVTFISLIVFVFINSSCAEVRIASGLLNGTTIPSAQFYKKGILFYFNRDLTLLMQAMILLLFLVL